MDIKLHCQGGVRRIAIWPSHITGLVIVILTPRWGFILPANFQMCHNSDWKIQGNAYPMNKRRSVSPLKDKQMERDLEGPMDPPYLLTGWFSYKEGETMRGLFQQNEPRHWLSSLWTSVTGTCSWSLTTQHVLFLRPSWNMCEKQRWASSSRRNTVRLNAVGIHRATIQPLTRCM